MADENRRAGWYPDPDGGVGERWWNGASWSDSRRGGPVPAAVPVPAPGAAAVASTAAAANVPVPPPATVVYSAANPAPQRPDPYAAGRTATWTGAVINATPGRNVDVQANKYAFYGFLTGVISVFFNLLFLLAPIAIVFSIIGIARARQLKAQGSASTLMTMALIGLATGSLSLVIALIGLVSIIAGVLGSVTITSS